MREIFTSGSVGGAPGNRCFYLEIDRRPTQTGAKIKWRRSYDEGKKICNMSSGYFFGYLSTCERDENDGL